MYVFFIFLNNLSYKEDISLGLISSSIENSFYLETSDINELLKMKIPIFKELLNDEYKNNKGIFLGFTENIENLNKFKNLLLESRINIDEQNIFKILYFEVNYL